MGETLKVERLKEIPAGETITLYRHGRFTDLCRGPHARAVSQIGAVKLLEASGVYWKGDEANERLQRIYGTAFASPREMEEYLERLEQARARDHRRLGQELDLFSFNPLAPAMPFLHPKGASIYNALVDYVRELYDRYGYGEVITPQILDVELWKTSGHYDNYVENMFFTEADERQMSVKPMNCPTHCLIFATRLRSYRDLPIRYADFGRLHRYERSGVTAGMFRVRSFAQDDAHIFCTEEQIEAEVLRGDGDDPRALPHLRLRRGGDRAVDAAGEADRLRRDVGPRRAGPGRALGRTAASPFRSTPATAPSTGRRSTSTSATRWAGAGSSAPSSSTTRCRSASA